MKIVFGTKVDATSSPHRPIQYSLLDLSIHEYFCSMAICSSNVGYNHYSCITKNYEKNLYLFSQDSASLRSIM